MGTFGSTKPEDATNLDAGARHRRRAQTISLPTESSRTGPYHVYLVHLSAFLRALQFSPLQRQPVQRNGTGSFLADLRPQRVPIRETAGELHDRTGTVHEHARS